MRSKFDAPYIGVIVGLLLPVLGAYGYNLYMFKTLNFLEFIEHIVSVNRITQLISLSVIVNLAAFYIFLQKKFYFSARGVIGATLLYTLAVLVMKFLV